jgi:hypothetical protein
MFGQQPSIDLSMRSWDSVSRVLDKSSHSELVVILDISD